MTIENLSEVGYRVGLEMIESRKHMSIPFLPICCAFEYLIEICSCDTLYIPNIM